MSMLKNFSRNNHAVFSETEWPNIVEINKILTSSEVIKSGKPVLYAGARWDMVHPLAFTDANYFIFVDPVYAKIHPEDQTRFMPDTDIKNLGGKVIEDKIEGVLGKGGKRILKFNLNNRVRTVTMYGEDAFSFVAPEVIESGGCSVLIIIGTDADITPKQEDDFYKQIAPKGYFVGGKPGIYKTPSENGFEKIIAKEEKGFSLYQKVNYGNAQMIR